MTQIEQIKAEIERLKEIGCPLQKGSDYQHGYDKFYTQIKKIINSLPAEQPSEDFKGEFDDYLVHGDIRNPDFEGPFGYDDIRKTAIHFAQWQKEQDKAIIERAEDHAKLAGIALGEKEAKEKFINKACEWLKRCVDVDDEVKMIDGEPEAKSFIKKNLHRIEVANQIVEDFKKAMEDK